MQKKKKLCKVEPGNEITYLDPPPSSAWLAIIRGNLQMLPVPTTEPNIDSITPSEEENVS